MNGLRILLLGPVQLWVGERQASLGGPKQRTLLALLALEPGRTVSPDHAAEALWGESVPEGYASRLHTVVSRLRASVREVGGQTEVIETTDGGYRLRVDPVQVDAARAGTACREARELRAAGQPSKAVAVTRAALALWRGLPLADLHDNGWAGDELRRLEELKIALLEEEFDARLALGASPGLVDELDLVCAQAPLRERLHAQLVLALGATGRRADALHEYDRVRRRLSEDLGIAPGALLREAHHAVLTAEPDGRLVPPSRGRHRPSRPGRRAIAILAVVLGAVVATVAALFTGGERRGPASLRVHAGELVIAGPGLKQVRAEIPLSGRIINGQPGGVVLADGSLWSVTEQGTVTQVDIARGRIIGSTPLALPAGPGGMAVGMGAAWVTDSGSPTLYRIGSGVIAAHRIPLPPLGSGAARATGGVAVAAGSIWVVREAAQTVDRLSPAGRLEHRFRIPGAEQIVGDARGVWVASGDLGVVTKLDPQTNTVRARIRLRPVVCCLALGGGSVWATSLASGLLWQLRASGTVEDVVHVPAPATEIAYADGAVWIAGYTGGTVTRVDAGTLDVHVTRTGQPVAGMAAAPGVVAFSTFWSERAALAGVRGPVARIVMPHDYAADTDPAVGAQYGDIDADRQRLAATCLSLYEHRDGRLVPYAATGRAVRARGGRVWNFRVHPGFAFSPPSDERVDAGTFGATIERSTSPALARSAAAKALADVEGMSAYRRGLTSHLAGVQAHGASLTIHLRRPVADLDARLAAPWFCAVPKGTPAIPTGLQAPIPSAGPYYVAAGSGSSWMVLRRNPRFPHPDGHRFGAFIYRFDVEERQALDMLRHGRADYVAFYGTGLSSRLPGQLGAGGDALGVRFRHRSRTTEFLGHRVGCPSYSPLYAGVELKRLCPVGG